VADAVRRLAARRAQCIFWIGLHDASLIGEEIGRKWFSRLFESLNPFAFVSRALQVNAVMLYRYSSVLRRAWSLRKGAPLDDLHFHYFTRVNVRDALAWFGAIRQVMEVPGSASMFATVEVTDAGRV
jgi:hypothetical protein